MHYYVCHGSVIDCTCNETEAVLELLDPAKGYEIIDEDGNVVTLDAEGRLVLSGVASCETAKGLGARA